MYEERYLDADIIVKRFSVIWDVSYDYLANLKRIVKERITSKNLSF